MDLTSRNLPRLCVKMELKPMLLHFAPYSKDEIADILKKRLTIVSKIVHCQLLNIIT